jgi:hypothetical protein
MGQSVELIVAVLEPKIVLATLLMATIQVVAYFGGRAKPGRQQARD